MQHSVQVQVTEVNPVFSSPLLRRCTGSRCALQRRSYQVRYHAVVGIFRVNGRSWPCGAASTAICQTMNTNAGCSASARPSRTSASPTRRSSKLPSHRRRVGDAWYVAPSARPRSACGNVDKSLFTLPQAHPWYVPPLYFGGSLATLIESAVQQLWLREQGQC